MPEGDSIFRLAAKLAPALEKTRVLACSARRLSSEDARSLVGRTITTVSATGKNLLITFDDARILHVHLRMYGRLSLERPRSSFWLPESAAPDLRLTTEGGTVVGRRLPVLRLIRGSSLPSLGPDLVRPGWSETQALAGLRALQDHAIADALLVQRAVAGIGNVYKSEVLFLERIDPRLPVRLLNDDTLRRLLQRASELLQRNLGDGPRITRVALGGPRLWVYGRSGRPCLRCSAEVIRFVQSRSTYACPACQERTTGAGLNA
jgi:endonuclease-8